ncbi:hypothetical protein D0S45_12070 [Marinifilum sp. JC120]|nr:hypothetical protein D0S45_12070 [Marinifilum sp. JC120]
MKISRKIKAAITVAAIAGTCALSCPSFAAWTPQNLTTLGTGLGQTASNADDVVVTVGDAGKIFRMPAATAQGSTPAWTQDYAPATADFVGVVSDNSKNFWAVTQNGTIVKSNTAGTSWAKVAIDVANARTAITADGTNVVAITTTGTADDIAIVTDKGTIAYYDASAVGTKWSSIGGTLSGADIVTAGIKGATPLTGSANEFVVFGAGSGAGSNEKNAVTVNIDASIIEHQVTNCPTINSMSINTATEWYAVGNTKVAIKGTTDLAGGAGTEGSAALTVTGATGDPNLLAIDYDFASTFGYITAAGGQTFRIVGSDINNVTQGATTNDLNSAALIVENQLRRAFVSGTEGDALYGNEVFWTGVTKAGTGVAGTTNAPTAPELATSDRNGRIFVLQAAKLSTTITPGGTWTEAAEEGTCTDPNGNNIIYHSKDGDEKFIFASTNGAITPSYVFNPNDSSITGFAPALSGAGATSVEFLAKTSVQLVAIDAEAFAPEYIVLTGASSGSSFTQAATSTGSTVSGAVGTYYGLYILAGGTAATNLKALTTGTEVLSNDLSAGDAYDDPTALTGVGKILNSMTGLTLAPTSDGTGFFVISATNTKKVLYISDSAADIKQDTTFATQANLQFPDAYGTPVSIYGIPSDCIVATATAVYRYTSATGWEKYDDLTSRSDLGTFNAINSVVSYATGKILAVDSTTDDIAYSDGAAFTATGLNPAYSSTINTVCNATKNDVYLGGADGFIYKGTKADSAETFTWTASRSGLVGSKDVTNITSAGNELFMVFGTKEFAHKATTEDSWTEVTTKTSIADVTDVNDAQALSATIFFVADSANAGLVEAELTADDTLVFTRQTSGSGAAMPAALTSLSVLDADTIYGVTGSKLYKFHTRATDAWTIVDVTLPEVGGGTLNDVVAISSSKIFAVGDAGLAYSYDGSTATKLTAPSGNPNMKTCWAYADILYAGASDGKVYAYDIDAGTWTPGTVADGKTLTEVTGSQKGSYLLAVGADGTCSFSEISSSGGGEDSTATQPGDGEDSDLVSTSSVETVTATNLATTYSTPSDMTVIGQKQSFTSKATLTAGSTHNFKFNVTPTTATPVNDIRLYKLKTVSGSNINITYNRVDSVPSSKTDGDFWITSGATVMGAGTTLAANTVYTVNLSIEDGGPYDTDGTANGQIADPTVLGTGSSGSSGCVFNPAQTFGMEWLMLAFAPIAAFFRSRFKK